MPPQRAAPLVFVVDPAGGAEAAPAMSYRAAAVAGQRLLAAELSARLGRLGAAVLPLRAVDGPRPPPFHWGRWFAAQARHALEAADAGVDAIGYAGAGSLALLGDAALDALLSPVRGEAVANNRFSADAWVAAGDTDRVLAALEACDSDNAAPRALETLGFHVRDLGGEPFSRFDVDTPLDLALLRLATRLPTTRRLDGRVSGYLEMARLPGDRPLEVPHLARLGDVIRDRTAELVVAGRVPSATLGHLETETACRVRAFVEERGMRSARTARPRSFLARWLERLGPADLVGELSRLGDAVVLDSRVVMAALAGTSDGAAWPPPEERFASDFGDATPIATVWLRELTAAAAGASAPILLGGHALVSDGLRVIVEAAWLGR
ncbi:MAG TPA: hypothetical protein VHK06_03795 [Candidatus Limnocylindria bacterium]|nr:hypothetical protein [Candidatus Limnocylindria bacterium]